MQLPRNDTCVKADTPSQRPAHEPENKAIGEALLLCTVLGSVSIPLGPPPLKAAALAGSTATGAAVATPTSLGTCRRATGPALGPLRAGGAVQYKTRRQWVEEGRSCTSIGKITLPVQPRWKRPYRPVYPFGWGDVGGSTFTI